MYLYKIQECLIIIFCWFQKKNKLYLCIFLQKSWLTFTKCDIVIYFLQESLLRETLTGSQTFLFFILFFFLFCAAAASLPSKTRKLFCWALNHVRVLTPTVFTPTSSAAVNDEGQSGVPLHFSHGAHTSIHPACCCCIMEMKSTRNTPSITILHHV